MNTLLITSRNYNSNINTVNNNNNIPRSSNAGENFFLCGVYFIRITTSITSITINSNPVLPMMIRNNLSISNDLYNYVKYLTISVFSLTIFNKK